MAYNSVMNTVYNHYLTTYAPKKTTTQYDTHKKSELRSIYNSILKLNKDAPLYILDNSRESREFAVGLKENARLLRNTIASLGGVDEREMFQKKSAYSSNEDMAEASFIGKLDENGEAPSFTIEVTALASNQENLGTVLPSEESVKLPPDAYSFDITINDLSYEFQYNVREEIPIVIFRSVLPDLFPRPTSASTQMFWKTEKAIPPFVFPPFPRD